MFTRHTGFMGLQPNLTVPPPNSASDCKNMIRDRVRGRLRLSPGYSEKMALPFQGGSDASHMIQDIVWRDIHEIAVEDHGGANIQIVVGTYTKLDDALENVNEPRWGIWARPYWNGSAWIDAWIELSENYIFSVVESGVVADRLVLGADVTLDPVVFDANKLTDWVLVRSLAHGPEVQFMCIKDSALSIANTRLTVHVDAVTDGAWTNERVYLMRDVVCRIDRANALIEFPTSITNPFCESIQHEARVNSGNSPTDFTMMVGFRKQTLGWTGPRKVIDRLLCENAFTREVFSPTAHPPITSTAGLGTESGNGLDAGTYELETWLVLEDGQEIDPLTYIGSLTVNATPDQVIEFTISTTLGWLPIRARYFRVAISKDKSPYNVVKLLDLKDLIWTDANGVITSSTQKIGLQEYTAKDAIVSAQMGRDPVIEGKGIVRYLRAGTFGKQRVVSGIIFDGLSFPNTLYSCVASGDGAIEWDIIPGGEARIIDVEYSDGDSVLLPAILRERIIAFKNKAIVALTPSGSGFDRDLMTSGVGICSVEGACVLRDSLYWPDHSGIYMLSFRGYEIINLSWIEEWKAYTAIQRAGTIVSIDRQYGKIIFSVPVGAGCMNYVYDSNDGEWMKEVTLDVPLRFNRGAVTTVEWLTGVNPGRTSIKVLDFTKVLQGGVTVPFFYKWNNVRNEKGSRWDILANTVYLSYISTVDLTLGVFLDDVLVQSFPLVAGTASQIIPFPLASICKKFGFRVSGQAVAENDFVEIVEEGYDFEYIPAGGDVLRF